MRAALPNWGPLRLERWSRALSVAEVRVRGRDLMGAETTLLSHFSQEEGLARVAVDGVACASPAAALEAWLARIESGAVEAWARPRAALRARLGLGVELGLAPQTTLHLRGEFSGGEAHFCLTGGLEIWSSGGALMGENLPLAGRISLQGVRLDPQGRVHLRGAGGRAEGMVLRAAGRAISAWVWAAPRWGSVRGLLCRSEAQERAELKDREAHHPR